MNTPNKKFKDAKDKNVRVINLNWLMQLLTGNLQSFDGMHKLITLTKAVLITWKITQLLMLWHPHVDQSECDRERCRDWALQL